MAAPSTKGAASVDHRTRAAHEMRAELLEDDRSLDHSEPEAAVGLRHAQGEDPELGQLAPGRAIDPLAVALGDALEREPRRAEAPDGVLELELFFVEAEVHARRRRPSLAGKYLDIKLGWSPSWRNPGGDP